ncbi:hypothetical protein [Bacillus kwashiorkori]|uniref:hypothetical protein n=1 Tax=Bacillus kwashiorkori TaxID=1522318 RepID=UPI000784C7BD|nr:hypothetical protein [Bacillus kwashiorkori]
MEKLQFVITITQDANGLFEMRVAEKSPNSKLREMVFQSYSQWFSFMKRNSLHQFLLTKTDKNAKIIDHILRLAKEHQMEDQIFLIENNNHPYPLLEVPPFDTFINGFRTFLTGLYPHTYHYTKVKHLFVHKSNLSPELKMSLLNNSNINSSYISQEEEEDDNWFGIAQIRIENQQQMEYFSAKLQLNQHIHNQPFVFMKLHRYVTAGKEDLLLDKPIFLTIDDQADLDVFSQLVMDTFSKGQMKIKNIIPSFKDECMWADKSMCSLRTGTRLAISEQKRILDSPICYSFNHTELHHQSLSRLIESEFTKSFIQSGCKNCPALLNCPTCIRLQPESLEKEQYCNIRREQSFVTDYVKIRNILKTFVHNKENKNDVEASLYFSTTKVKKFYQRERVLTKEINYNDCLIFSFHDEDYIYINKELKFYKINRPLAIVIEGILLNDSVENIYHFMLEKYHWKREMFDKLLVIGDQLFKKIGIANRMEVYD